MRASRRRLDHSTEAGSSAASTARSLKRPWMAKPSASRTASPMVTRPGGRPVRSARSPCVSGDATSRWPRSTWAAACSAVVPSTSTPSTSARTADVASTVCHRSEPSSPTSDATRPRLLQRVEELGPLRRARAQQERAQEVVELVGRGGRRLDLGPDAVDRLLGDPPDLLDRDREAPPQRHGARAPVDGLAVVEERVRRGVEDLVGEQRRLGGVDEVEAHLARLHPPPQLDEARRSRAPR